MTSSDPVRSLEGSPLDRSFLWSAILLALPLVITLVLATSYLRATLRYSAAVEDAAAEVAGVLLRDFFDIVFARAGRDATNLFRDPAAWSAGSGGSQLAFEADISARMSEVADSLVACACVSLPIRSTAVYSPATGVLAAGDPGTVEGWRSRIGDLDLATTPPSRRLHTATGQDSDGPWFVYLLVTTPLDRTPLVLLADIDLARLGPDLLAPAFADVVRTHDLTRATGARGISLRIDHPQGHVIFEVGSGTDGPAYALPLFGTDLGSTNVPGTRPLLARLALQPEGVAALIPGGLPRSPWPLAVVSVLMAVILTAVGCFVLHRLRRFTLARELFLTTVSHELRTPLAIVLAYAETVGLSRPAPESRRRAATVIAREARRMTYLVENALAFSHGQRSTATLDSREIDLQASVSEVVDDFRLLAEGQDVRLVMRAGAIATARVDVSALRQIVNNLLENALRYGPPGQEIAITVTKRRTSVELRVTDEGPGFPSGAGGRLWKPFNRHDSRGTTTTSGTGLGLAIVRQLVELHDGTVHAANRPERGAVFTVRFPAATTTAVEAPEAVWHAS